MVESADLSVIVLVSLLTGLSRVVLISGEVSILLVSSIAEAPKDSIDLEGILVHISAVGLVDVLNPSVVSFLLEFIKLMFLVVVAVDALKLLIIVL